MSAQVFWPHALIEPGTIEFSPWEWSTNSSIWHSIDDEVKGWDRNTDIAFRHVFRLGRISAPSEEALDPGERPWLVTLIDCPATQERVVASRLLSQPCEDEQVIRIPSGTMSGRIQLERHIVAGNDVSPNGRRLLSDGDFAWLHINENPNRFPVEAFSFSSVPGLPPTEWKIHLLPGTANLWSSSFRDAVEIWINTDRDDVAKALTQSEHGYHALLTRVLERDIIWSLFAAVRADESYEEAGGEFDPGSVGESLNTFARAALKMAVGDYLALLELDPGRALAELHRSLPLTKLSGGAP